jgi:hypothetical protein
MLRLLQNSLVRFLVSAAAAVTYGLIFFGGLRDWVGPVSAWVIVLLAIPLLGYGFYLNMTAIAGRAAAEKA